MTRFTWFIHERKVEVKVKIDNYGGISSLNNISSDKTLRKPAKDETPVSSKGTTDRVEIGVRTSAEEASAQIKENILRAESQKTSNEKLEAIKNRIKQNKYHVDTEEIIKSII